MSPMRNPTVCFCVLSVFPAMAFESPVAVVPLAEVVGFVRTRVARTVVVQTAAARTADRGGAAGAVDSAGSIRTDSRNDCRRTFGRMSSPARAPHVRGRARDRRVDPDGRDRLAHAGFPRDR